LAVWLTCVAASGAALAFEPSSSPGKPQDLTGMSLEDLLHEDIVPMNVLGNHTHLKGEIMIGYSYMYTDMSHNQNGTHEVSQAEVLQSYPVVHTHMTMQMHMIDLMYAPSDTVTLMAMIPFEQMSMEHLTRTGERPTAYSSGLGDVTLMGLVNLLGNPRTLGQRLVLNAGLTLPTGSINQSENGQQLEYEMQLGSGTVDLLPGLTYLGESENFNWGAQALGRVRLGSNANDYRLGDGYRLGAWTQMKVFDWFGPSARLDWHGWGNVAGADPSMNPARNPGFDAKKQSGERLDFLLGINFYIPKGPLKGNRLSIEGGVPLYQNIAGPNIAVDWMIAIGWTYSF
jgi:hypothetical protein